MKVYPAIDLMDGQAVRLYKGRREEKKIYGDPLEIAIGYSQHFEHLHVIDLDGAFSGETKNLELVKQIYEKTGMKIQYGGGLRSMEAVRKAYSSGVTNAIIGTKAFDRMFVLELTREFDSITIGLDSRNKQLAIKGWVEESGRSLEETFEVLRSSFSRFVFTDIEKDGTNEGISDIHNFWMGSHVIYAGGVSSLEDIQIAADIGFDGVVIGRALLEGSLTYEQLRGVGEICSRRE